VKRDDADLEAGTIRISGNPVHGTKNSESRIIPINPPMHELCGRLLEDKREPRDAKRRGKGYLLKLTDCREALANACLRSDITICATRSLRERSRLRYRFRPWQGGSAIRTAKLYWFGAGERALDDWLERSARTAWMVCDEPWKIEEYLIRTVSLPLNLDQNRHHLFRSELSGLRRMAKAQARELPIAGR
jgi:hypothetical protein